MNDDATNPTELDERKLIAETCLARVVRHPSLPSTQDWARNAATSLSYDDLPLLVVADEQTAGRGRGVNTWWTGAGSLAFSLLFDPRQWDLELQATPLRSLAVGVAIVETIRSFCPHTEVHLRWPNDVLLARRKVSGVLIDILPDGNHLIGVGVNTNNSLSQAPPDVLRRAISISETTGSLVDHTEFLIRLLSNLELALRESSAAPERLAHVAAAMCVQVGAALVIDAGSRTLEGRCLGIADDGGLVMETLAGRQVIYSGSVRE